jgi:NADH dehydrogenase FAD-containing subunit
MESCVGSFIIQTPHCSLPDFLREGMKFYHRLKKDIVRVVVVDPGDHILPELGKSLGHYAQKKLRARGRASHIQRQE